MKQYNFATIVTVKDNFPSATHLPFIIEENTDEIILSAHFAKANSQWREITENEVLVVFQEPHACISPAHYDSTPNVPTWDYVAVHAYGKGEIVEKLEVIENLILQHESEYLEKWRNFKPECKSKMLAGIVAFQIRVTKIEAKKKLNQSSSKGEREKIIRSLEKSESGVERDLAKYMKDL